MADAKVKVKFEISKLLSQFWDTETKDKMGRLVVQEAKRLVDSGQSPVRGEGRFEKYSPSYRETIKSGGIPGKTISPVNLQASGEMMKDFDYNPTRDAVEVGFVKPSSRTRALVEFHQEGTDNMPARKLVPTDGEAWAVSVERVIKAVYSERLSDIIESSNQS